MKYAVGSPGDKSPTQTVQITYVLRSSSEKFPTYPNSVLDRVRSCYFKTQDFDGRVTT